ncbi:MAG: transposase [Desulfobacterales bacterium]|nr:MAG: transposase [Desulfobacterales bacterium]
MNQGRLLVPVTLYHVINRGNKQEEIFKNQRDKEKFLEYLEKAAERFSMVIHTYCLMSNHYFTCWWRPRSRI